MGLRNGEHARLLAEQAAVDFYYKKMKGFFRLHKKALGIEKEPEQVVYQRFVRAAAAFKEQGNGFYLCAYKGLDRDTVDSVLECLEDAYIQEYWADRIKRRKKSQKIVDFNAK